MKDDMIYPVQITLKSTLDGETTSNNYAGECRIKNGIYTIVYTEYTGNMFTKVGIEASKNAMLIHRVGAFEGDMFFDPGSDTSFRYDTLGLTHEFLLHTAQYELKELSQGLLLYVKYVMTDHSSEQGICGLQEITVTKPENTSHEENI